jgi:hypothetical protein
MTRVLVGFSDAIALPETVFSLLDAGHDVHLLASTTQTPSLCKYIPNLLVHSITAPERDAAQSIADFRKVLQQFTDKDVFLALDDRSLWLANAASENAPLPVRQASAFFSNADLALQKTRQTELAQQCGFALPETVIVRHGDDFPENFPLPAIVRPALAVQNINGCLNKGKTVYLTKPEDIAKLKHDPALTYPVLLQPLVHGVGQGLFGFAGADGVVCWSAHERVRMMNPHGSGASACKTNTVDLELQKKATEFLTKSKWRGPFMFELLNDKNGKNYFIEFNGRLWGSLALARRAGFEYPAWAVQQAVNPDFMPSIKTSTGPHEVRHLGRDLLHILYVLKGPKTSFHRETWPSLGSAIWNVLQIKSGPNYYNYDPRYPRFFLRDTVDNVLRQFIKRKS